MVRLMRTLAVAALFTMTGCSSGDSPTGFGGAGGTFTATVDGEAWAGEVDELATYYNGFVFSLYGADGGIEIGLTVSTLDPDATVPGTLDLTAGFTGAQIGQGSDTWVAGGIGGSGTLTITELDAAGARGTFSFVGVPFGGNTTGTRTVTNGSFNVTF